MARPNWMHRGDWQPGQISGAQLVVQLAVLTQCLIRGLDYLRHDSDPSSVLSRVQDSAPLPVWGLAFTVAAAIAVVGLAGGWGWLLAVGHGAAMVCYASITYGLLLQTGLGPGIRTPAGLACAALVHGTLALSIFAILRRREELEHPSSTA